MYPISNHNHSLVFYIENSPVTKAASPQSPNLKPTPKKPNHCYCCWPNHFPPPTSHATPPNSSSPITACLYVHSWRPIPAAAAVGLVQSAPPCISLTSPLLNNADFPHTQPIVMTEMWWWWWWWCAVVMWWNAVQVGWWWTSILLLWRTVR